MVQRWSLPARIRARLWRCLLWYGADLRDGQRFLSSPNVAKRGRPCPGSSVGKLPRALPRRSKSSGAQAFIGGIVLPITLVYVVALVYLAAQIRANTSATRAQISQSRSEQGDPLIAAALQFQRTGAGKSPAISRPTDIEDRHPILGDPVLGRSCERMRERLLERFGEAAGEYLHAAEGNGPAHGFAHRVP